MWKPGQIVTIARTKYRVIEGCCFYCPQRTVDALDEPCRTCLAKKDARTKEDKNFYLSRICGKPDK